ncbi:MAG: DNA primase [Lactobacillales bacterium]|jgi:DNA primase|nr:DNA primase [Lactobacillales bacterium]
MAFPPRFLDDLRDKTVLSEVVGKKVKLTRKGREFSGLCPFHQEKTPSFTVNDEKGFYHCFGCGAHGDAIKFLMDNEKLPFTEAVEHLAGRVGMQVPKQSPGDAFEAAKRNSLSDIMEEASRFFENTLFSTLGDKAREYLKKRHLNGKIAKQFRLGYAPYGSALSAHLTAKGYSLKECQSLGLVAFNKERGQTHDYFYDRIMFPILNRRGKVIAFGGRIMGKGEPKYLNSPETELFHKGEQLYGLPQSIDTIRKTNTCVLVEGYMDVIALHATGFTNALAPLGTALTESQIKILWQLTDEPIICFDGDLAGRKASLRALSRALPILMPGKSLRFVMLPDKFDPDDMIHKKSPEAFEQALKGTLSVADLLWESLLEGRSLDTPERMAKLQMDIEKTLSVIKNASVKSYYQKDFKNRMWKLEHAKRGSKTLSFQKQKIINPTPVLGAAKMMLAALYLHPHLLEEFMEEITKLDFPASELKIALHEMIALFIENPDITTAYLQKNMTTVPESVVKEEIEMLKKSARTAGDVKKELFQIIKDHQKIQIKAQIEQKLKAVDTQEAARVWEEISQLKKEIEKLEENI